MTSKRGAVVVYFFLILFNHSFVFNNAFLSSSPIKKNNIHYKTTVTKWQPPLSLGKLPSIPRVSSTDVWGNWAILSLSAVLAQSPNNIVTKLLGPPVTAMAITFALATMGILTPGGTAAAKTLQLKSLELATPLVLLGAGNLRQSIRKCGPLLPAFCSASLSTMTACTLSWLVVGKYITTAAATNQGLIVAAALLAKNIGGGINYVAVCQSLRCSPQAFTAGLCVDNIFGLIYFPISNALASRYGDPEQQDKETNLLKTTTKDDDVDDLSTTTTMTVRQVSTVLSLSIVLTWLGQGLARRLFSSSSAGLACVTLLTTLVASLAPRQWMKPLESSANVLGTTLLYLFFSTAGAPGMGGGGTTQSALFLPLGLYLCLLYGLHGTLLWLLHYCFRKNNTTKDGISSWFVPQRLLVASSAAIGGPATAVALAQSVGWKSQIVPSLLVGNIGYVIATFAGLLFYAIFST